MWRSGGPEDAEEMAALGAMLDAMGGGSVDSHDGRLRSS